MKNSSEKETSVRINDSISNSGQPSSDIVMQLEACSLGEIPPNLNEDLISQALDR